MSYLVIAPCVIAKDQEGKNQHRYEGDVISWLSDDQAEHFVEAGLVESTSKGVGGSAPVDETSVNNYDVEAAPEDGKPAEGATKAELIDWLVANALDENGTEYTESRLQPKNKAELRDLIDAVDED